MIKFYCDRCKKEINYVDYSVITIENETKAEEQKAGHYLTFPKQNFLFGFEKRSFILCQECSYIFKKYWEQYMNTTKHK